MGTHSFLKQTMALISRSNDNKTVRMPRRHKKCARNESVVKFYVPLRAVKNERWYT